MEISNYLKQFLGMSKKTSPGISVTDAVSNVKKSVEQYNLASDACQIAEEASDQWVAALTESKERLTTITDKGVLARLAAITEGVDSVYQSTQDEVQRSEAAVVESMREFEEVATSGNGGLNGLTVAEDGDQLKNYIKLRDDMSARSKQQSVLPSHFKFAKGDLSPEILREVLAEVFDPSSEPIQITKDGLVVSGVTDAVYSGLFQSVDEKSVTVLPYSSSDVDSVLKFTNEIASGKNLGHLPEYLQGLSVQNTAAIYKSYVKGGRTLESLRNAFASKGLTIALGGIAVNTTTGGTAVETKSIEKQEVKEPITKEEPTDNTAQAEESN